MAAKLRQYFGNAPIKLIAVILFAVFVPSVLVTALGLVAVFQAQSYVLERFTTPVRQKVEELRARLGSEWGHRLGRYAHWLQDAARRPGHLEELRERDPWIEAVFLGNAAGVWAAPDPPPRRLMPAPAEPELKELRRLELLARDLPAALELSQRLVAANADEALVSEALLAQARLSYKLGDRERGLQALGSALTRFGNTIDATGVVLAVPVLLRMLEIEREITSPAPLSPGGSVRELANWLERARPHMAAESLEFFQQRFAALVEPAQRAPDARLATRARHAQAATPFLPTLATLGARSWVERHFEVPGFGEHDVLSFRAGELLVHLKLSRARHVQEVEQVCLEVGLPVAGLALKPVGRTPSPLEAVSSRLPPPLENLQVIYTPVGGLLPEGFRAFGFLSLATFTWSVIVLVLTIFLGVLFTVRSVLREMRTARLKSDFVSFITHELKTPLTAISTLTETMLAGRVDSEEENKFCIQLISTETERLSKLVGQVLEYSRIERREKEFRFASCDMEDVVHDAVRIFHEHNRANPRVIEVNSAQHISKIKLDRAAMIELLLNLLSNAAKYSPRDKSIQVNLRETIAEICVEVVDRGIGIRKRDQKRIFEKFFRADDYLTREIEGTGLGLTFARYIARVHNGDIRVTSQVSAGSTFSLHLRKTHILAE